MNIKYNRSIVQKSIYYLDTKFWTIIISILTSKIIYIYYFNNRSGDFGRYERIVDGILNGCGFAIRNNDEICTTIVGHFFPGFFYYMSLFYSFGLGSKGFLISIAILHLSSAIYLFYIIKKYIRNIHLAKYSLLLLSLSPLTYGFNRLLLMEPLLTVFSIFLLAEIIKILYEGFSIKSITILFIIQILSLYIKATSIVFSIPVLLVALFKFKLIEFIRKAILWILIIVLSIAPWGMRNLSLSATRPFPSVLESNFMPPNNSGYLSWLSTWVVTEHELARNGSIIWKNPLNLNPQKNSVNPFISSLELEFISKRYKDKDSFSKADDDYFGNLSNQRLKKLGLSGILALNLSKIMSIFFNPMNSWGWPLEISQYLKQQNILLNDSDISSKISLILNPEIFKRVFLKVSLLFYRIILFYNFFSVTFFSFLKASPKIKVNQIRNRILLCSIFLLSGIIYIIVFQFNSLEHRFISVAIPWIEFSCLFYYLNHKSSKIQ